MGSDEGHRVWDGDGGQAAAIIEGIVAKGCDGVWDDDRSQACQTATILKHRIHIFNFARIPSTHFYLC